MVCEKFKDPRVISTITDVVQMALSVSKCSAPDLLSLQPNGTGEGNSHPYINPLKLTLSASVAKTPFIGNGVQ